MGRLKKEHSGWHTSGLWLKYQSPKVVETPVKAKSKKDTVKWCRGKVGVEHDWHRFENMKYDWEIDGYVDKYIHLMCMECKKEKYTKTAKSANYPLHIWIDQKYCGADPIQVRVNGEYKPLTIYDFKKGKYYCRDCGYCH